MGLERERVAKAARDKTGINIPVFGRSETKAYRTTCVVRIVRLLIHERIKFGSADWQPTGNAIRYDTAPFLIMSWNSA